MDDISLIIERIDKNKSTESLNLNNCNIKILPPNLAQLIQLKNLYIENNKLIFIPEIGCLIQLEDLSLENNEITLLPESFSNLKQLKSLNLNRNPLKCLSGNLFVNFQCLSILWLNHCELMYLPKEIGNLKNLERLGLKENALDELPAELGQLVNLKWLNVEKNQLYKLSDSFKMLKNLSHLNLAHNKLDRIPDYFYEMKNLNILLLKQNDIRNFNDEMCLGLSFLNKLDLRNNPFVNRIKLNDVNFYKQLLCIKNFIISDEES
jgi:leucine-rich repeat protein SHOC2